ncbi:MAG: nucleotide sugar dehydrogenase [Spirochaetaceae bacterium]|nr:nucleotide sugar dehydrogenase [Spirochaetaceae bacterium]
MQRLVTIEEFEDRSAAIGVVGLGYVGVSLLVALARHFRVCGFDRDPRRIRELKKGFDRTRSVTAAEIGAIDRTLTIDESVLEQCKLIIISVPTPITPSLYPNLEPLKDAARAVARRVSGGSVIVIESTVYPGVTEGIVRPIITNESKLEPGDRLHFGYSPERINPGDGQHSLGRIPKVVAGDSDAVTDLLAKVYGAIANGVHQATSIKVAEAAKVLENTQRDVNIALMNEAATIFRRIGVDTRDVIRTASTKWNFAPFEPGLVGGDCIATDPYYLLHIARKTGTDAAVISASRDVNDGMGRYVAEHTGALIRSRSNARSEARVLILGISFKENVPRVQNTRVVDIVDALVLQRVSCSVFDPIADADEVRALGYDPLTSVDRDAPYDAVVVAVKHRLFITTLPITRLLKLMVPGKGVLVDVKSMYDRREVEKSGMIYWSL